MASIITLDGVGATNEWGEEVPTSFGWGDAAQTFVGWGILTFAAATAALRAREALRSRGLWPRGTVNGLFGSRRRKRRR